MTDKAATALRKDWQENPRWKGVKRPYKAEDVVRLRGNVQIEHTLARRGAENLWKLVNTEPYVNCLGALTAGQAMQQVKAGIKAIYLSGWQVAADNNTYLSMYPDQSLYPVDSVPKVVERINATFKRADEIQCSRGIHPGSPDYVGLLRADRGGRRSRLRRGAERPRAHEGHDPRRRRRRALRGPARVREEVRSHGRQGAGADPGSGAEARCSAFCGRRHGRADDRARANRR